MRGLKQLHRLVLGMLAASLLSVAPACGDDGAAQEGANEPTVPSLPAVRPIVARAERF